MHVYKHTHTSRIRICVRHVDMHLTHATQISLRARPVRRDPESTIDTDQMFARTRTPESSADGQHPHQARTTIASIRSHEHPAVSQKLKVGRAGRGVGLVACWHIGPRTWSRCKRLRGRFGFGCKRANSYVLVSNQLKMLLEDSTAFSVCSLAHRAREYLSSTALSFTNKCHLVCFIILYCHVNTLLCFHKNCFVSNIYFIITITTTNYDRS